MGQGTDISSDWNVQGQTHIKDNFNFVQGHSLTHYDRQSDIVDYRAAYFAAKNNFLLHVRNHSNCYMLKIKIKHDCNWLENQLLVKTFQHVLAVHKANVN